MRQRPAGRRRASGATVEADRRIALQVAGEIVLLLGWGRAILLQIAHPLVAAGVAEHSVFASHPHLRLYRFYRTVSAMLSLLFGSAEAAAATARRIRRIHDRVHGVLNAPAGPFPAGTPYSAHDPSLLKWVHATLVDSFLLIYEMFVAPLAPAERDAYCREAARVTGSLGVAPALLPQTYAEVQTYMHQMVASGVLTVTPEARKLAEDVLHPPVPAIAWPALALARLITAGLLPAPIRHAYGLRFDRRSAVLLDRTAWFSRKVLPWIPPAIRRWPGSDRPR
jgi:uncharacterized protein (DUF2236 family)